MKKSFFCSVSAASFIEMCVRPACRFTVWLRRVTLTPSAIGIINNAALCAHVQYHLHLSLHDTKSIPLKTCMAVQNVRWAYLLRVWRKMREAPFEMVNEKKKTSWQRCHRDTFKLGKLAQQPPIQIWLAVGSGSENHISCLMGGQKEGFLWWRKSPPCIQTLNKRQLFGAVRALHPHVNYSACPLSCIAKREQKVINLGDLLLPIKQGKVGNALWTDKNTAFEKLWKGGWHWNSAARPRTWRNTLQSAEKQQGEAFKGNSLQAQHAYINSQ